MIGQDLTYLEIIHVMVRRHVSLRDAEALAKKFIPLPKHPRVKE